MKRTPLLHGRALALAAVLILFSSHFALSQATASPSAAPRTKASQQSDSRRFDALLYDRRYPELAANLPSAQLPPLDRDYFEGVLANRQNRLADAIRLLEKAIPGLKGQSPERASIALHALADSYVKSYRYRDALPVYAELLGNYSRYLEKSERKSTNDDYKTIQILKDAPPQTVQFTEPVTVPTHHSKLGTIDADLTVNGVTRPWIIDTGANFSVVTESLAKALGLTLSAGQASTQGITGAENPLHVAILPELHIGSAVIRNVVLLVMRDRDLDVNFGQGHYQIDAILGYPVLSALGSITFEKNAVMFGPAQSNATAGAPLYMEFLTPLLQCRIGNRELLYSFDTGADHSVFTVKYYKQFRDTALRAVPLRRYRLGGAGGVRELNAYYQPNVQLSVGRQTANLKDVPVLPEPMGTDLDRLNGNLGRDVVEGFQSFTIDFAHMRFVLGEPLKTRAVNMH